MASLVNIDGPCKGAYYAIGTHTLIRIGREDDCEVQIPDPRVSRHHLQIRTTPDASGHLAADYRTANGTFINGKQVLEPRLLKDGDTICIGATTLMYTTADFSDAQSAMSQAKKKGEWNRTTLSGS